MYLPAMCYLDYVTEFGHFVVLWEFNAVGLVQSGHLLGVFTIVHQLEFSQQSDATTAQPVRGCRKTVNSGL